ncbi:hypothetical protein QVD17_03207 [Tagetes erecta]|uniref:TIR domain-containing protein n=1 Tax=Tagetes erecta TaxID=13708 RepID=A0AAD8P9T6_TARER|nr:hypothetical protein QVD17_03207 [Tagetes erecta]
MPMLEHIVADHLYTALKQAAVRTFRDDDEIRKGQDLEPEIVRAIKSSRASIVVLSQNYAKSRWCLEELSLILQQKKSGNHFVLPVFYHVDPSDVRNQRLNFAIDGSKWTEENVNRWKSALIEVAKLTGVVASGPETKFITYIVDTVCYELDLKLIKEALQMKKVLIVLDDIDDHEELDALLGKDVIHAESKIIITTRLRDIKSWFESISSSCRVCEHKLLNDHESLEVFSCHAFGSKLPLEGFHDLAIELAQYCGGNPLALKVLGSSLFVSAEVDPRERNIIIEIWKGRLNSLSSLKGNIDCKIQGVLQKSFDSLPLSIYKELFLDIVVFFIGEDEDYVVKILEYDRHAKSGIMTLVNRCLLSVSPNKKLVMHQLIQDMGRYIVREESKDPAKRSRVWCSDEAYSVLTKGDSSETIEGLTLDTRKLKTRTNAPTIKISSLTKMHKLKLLQLKYVKLSGSYKNFPQIRWFSWHGCQLKSIPSAVLMSSFLVAIDMTNGNLKMFKPPTALSSLKILNLAFCKRLVSIRKLCRLPSLETLILWGCRKLTRLCKTIGDLDSLALLNLAGCKRLWKSPAIEKHVNQPGRLKPLFSLPQSLKFLFLDFCMLEYDSDLRVVFNGPLYGMSLSANLFEFIPKKIELNMVRVLNLTSCINLKSILCLPCTLEELYINGCKSLEKVTFQSTRFRLRKFEYKGCFKLSEVQGLFKLVAIEELAEADLGPMKWIKAYQYNDVNLVCDGISHDRIWHIQMLYEYGIRSTYLDGVKEHTMPIFDHTSTCSFLSFRISLHSTKHRIQGLNVSCLYRSSGCKDEYRGCLWTIISNKSKGVTWMYNPVVYCKPGVEQYAMWLSYWPIGNKLDVGDEVYVEIVVGEEMRVHECGASLVFSDGGEIKQEEECDSNTMKEEVIGGDLSEFQLNTGAYYLCRRDFFKSSTPELIKRWFGDTIHYRDLQGWRKSYVPRDMYFSFMQLNYVPEVNRDTLYKRLRLGFFDKECDRREIMKAVSRLVGVDFVRFYQSSLYTDKKILFVLGAVDSMMVESCVRELENTIRIINVNYKVDRLRELYHRNIHKKIIGKIKPFIRSYVKVKRKINTSCTRS